MAKKFKPVLSATPSQNNRPKISPLNATKKRWEFSFQFWRQIRFFGLDKSEPKWFVSFLEKLQELSKENIDDFILNASKQENYRFHKINWKAINIPISRNELNWIHPDYLNNEDEYPFFQFQISMSLGRIVGFFDENRIFNIILLDPLHNIQPAKQYDYRVDTCNPLSCEFTQLKLALKELSESNDCEKPNCKLSTQLQDIYNFQPTSPNLIIFSLDDQDVEDAIEIISKGKISSYVEIFQTGIYLNKEN